MNAKIQTATVERQLAPSPTIRINTTPKMNAAALGQLFGPLILAGRSERAGATRDSVYPLRVGPLATTVSDAERRGYVLTERILREAVLTELSLRHGCAVRYVKPIAVAGSLLAVEFDADIIDGQFIDPFDLLAHEPIIEGVHSKLEFVGFAVREMLEALATKPSGLLKRDDSLRRQRIQLALGHFRQAGLHPYDLTTSEAALLQRVCAANIAICVREAHA